jgi:WD40 repeat protein
MIIVPSTSGTPKYMVYSTHEKVVGIIELPLDGNPNCAMGLIAHSGEISDICVSYDGNHLFTAGSNDFTVNQWSIHGEFLRSDRMPREDAYISLIEGGAEGEFFQEIKQYFYYAQVRR